MNRTELILARRRAMMANVEIPEPPQYIQDGLVFHLDGEDATTEQWVDRIGGKVFDMHNVTKTEKGDGVYFKYTLDSYGLCTTQFIFAANTHTIEAVLLPIDEGNMGAFGIDRAGTICFGTYNHKVYIATNTSHKQWSVSLSGKHTYSASLDRMLQDGVVKSSSNNDSFGSDGTGKVFLGRRRMNNTGTGQDYVYHGTIYQIRIYNRILTDEERIYNQAIDIKRYKITT